VFGLIKVHFNSIFVISSGVRAKRVDWREDIKIRHKYFNNYNLSWEY